MLSFPSISHISSMAVCQIKQDHLPPCSKLCGTLSVTLCRYSTLPELTTTRQPPGQTGKVLFAQCGPCLRYNSGEPSDQTLLLSWQFEQLIGKCTSM